MFMRNDSSNTSHFLNQTVIYFLFCCQHGLFGLGLLVVSSVFAATLKWTVKELQFFYHHCT